LLKYEVIGIFRINDIIDLPVVDSITAQRLCTIRDVIIDLRENRVYALVCKERLFRRPLEAIPFIHVAEISESSIAVASRMNIISFSELNIKHRRFQSYQSVLGKLVLSSCGDTLGVIRDIIIDTYSGAIKAYELSEGYIDDFLGGRHIMELDCGHTLTGKNVVLKERNTQYLFKNKL
jgi:uncharacterized protein YrrD